MLLTTANMSESKIGILRDLFHGPYTDFTADWYRDVGIIITKAMLISAVMPIIEFVMFYTMRNALRFLDRGFGRD